MAAFIEPVAGLLPGFFRGRRYNSGMQCNIDSKGKALRLIYGLLMIAAGLLVAALGAAAVLSSWWVWALAVFLLLAGGFGVFEARAGWCAVRAMGFKTPY